jgi:hypothetical protein
MPTTKMSIFTCQTITATQILSCGFTHFNLITPAEISYFRYYLEKIESKPEVIGYIKTYYYLDDFNRLFATFKDKSE